jgi:hypothetical protein
MNDISFTAINTNEIRFAELSRIEDIARTTSADTDAENSDFE